MAWRVDMGTPEKPPACRAIVETSNDGLRVALPPLGPLRYWRELLLLIGMLAFVLCLGTLAVWYLPQARDHLELSLCLVVLGASLLFGLKGVLLLGRLWRLAVARWTITLSANRLILCRGDRKWTWEPGTIAALDEEEGALGILHAGRLEMFLAGRDVEELAWLAELVRQQLCVPADPPRQEGEVLVSYHLSGWHRPRRGFVMIAPGRFRLRPRFSMNTGLILRPAGAGLESGRAGIEGLRAGCMSIREEDISWGVGAGGHAVLRIWLHEGKKQPVLLEITSERLDELRRAMECFWSR